VSYYAKQAQAAQKAGNTAQAVSLYEKGAALGAQWAPLMYTNEAFAYLSAAKPDYKAAKAAADRALAVKPDSAEANYAAGIALANSGNTKDAIPYLQRADAAAKASGDTSLATRAEQALSKISGGK
jgi:tetratricopeptide (TPR) repeat protein